MRTRCLLSRNVNRGLSGRKGEWRWCYPDSGEAVESGRFQKHSKGQWLQENSSKASRSPAEQRRAPCPQAKQVDESKLNKPLR